MPCVGHAVGPEDVIEDDEAGVGMVGRYHLEVAGCGFEAVVGVDKGELYFAVGQGVDGCP